MKKILFLFLSLAGISAAMGAQWVSIQNPNPGPAHIKLVSSSSEGSVIHFTLDGFKLNEVLSPKGKAFTVNVDGSTPILEKGAPDLPKLTTSLIIPDKGGMKAEVISSKFRDFPNLDIAPSKGNLTRNIDPATIKYIYGKCYNHDAFWPGNPIETRSPYIVRDYRGQTLIANVFSYNPVSRTLRVFYDITIKFSKTNAVGENQLIRKTVVKSIDPEFNALYSKQFLNFSSTKYTPVGEQGNLLIISYGPFMEAMQPYVNWKIAEGIRTQIVDVATIGGSAAIKSYVSNYYTDPGLAYLLLVGDNQQVPTFPATAGASDNSYGYLAGNDHYPDIFVGRFSGENVTHIQTQVAKVLYYEINPDTTSPWLRHGIGIGSDQGLGQGDDNEIDYQHIRNLSTQLKNYTYDSVAELFDGSQGGFDATGNPSPAMVATEVNKGAGVMLYTGHGSDNSWGTSGFSSTNVSALTNYGKLPFIWAVACVNGNFTSGTCFAETWLRATQGGQLTGAVATLMSTINQSWAPPMEGHDEMVSILTESYANNIKRTFGGISMNGCMKMNDTYGSGGNEMTDTWNLFGDPSLMVRTAVPGVMTVTHSPTAFLGSTQFDINCNHEGALACISLNNQILGTGYISGGSTSINFPSALSTIDTLKVVITAYNMLPYIGQAYIIAASGPYVSVQHYLYNDPSGNNNNYPDYGELISMDLDLQNLGIATANSVTAILSTTSPFITITDNSQSFGDILAGGQNSESNAYSFTVQGDVADMTPVPLTIQISDNNSGTWTKNLITFIHAPLLQANLLTVDDASTGNGNGFLDPGETANLIINTANIGHAATIATIAKLYSAWSGLTINNNNLNIGDITSNSSANAVFNVTLSAAAVAGTNLELDFQADAGPYGTQHSYFLQVGKVDEDFETGDFTKYNWIMGGDVPWIISSVTPFEGIYAAESGDISDSQSSTLSVMMEVLSQDTLSFYRKVSSEQNYDFLYFYMDGSVLGEWSGNLAWQKVSYVIGTGPHTFMWKYIKDDYQSTGNDAAWIDYIQFPPVSLTATGIVPMTSAIPLEIYPNPAKDKVRLEIFLEKPAQLSVSITDMLGKVVLMAENKNTMLSGSHHLELDVADFPNGIYIVQTQIEGRLLTKKLIINH
ncbi:MAG: C25 family cysteine peptidase [Bacteroidota bacterium]